MPYVLFLHNFNHPIIGFPKKFKQFISKNVDSLMLTTMKFQWLPKFNSKLLRSCLVSGIVLLPHHMSPYRSLSPQPLWFFLPLIENTVRSSSLVSSRQHDSTSLSVRSSPTAHPDPRLGTKFDFGLDGRRQLGGDALISLPRSLIFRYKALTLSFDTSFSYYLFVYLKFVQR